MNKKRIIIAATILYILFITLLSLVNLSGNIESVSVGNLDKLVHFCFYFSMNLLLILTVMICCRSSKTRRLWLITIVSIIYGIGIEIVQIHVGRDFDYMDILANSIGAIAALFFVRQTTIANFFKRYLQLF